MSRISLISVMLLVVLAVGMSQSVSTHRSITVANAGSVDAVTVRGGATNCSTSYHGGFCGGMFMDTADCAGQPCSQDEDTGIWSCDTFKFERNRWLWLDCGPVVALPWTWHENTTCVIQPEDVCFFTTTCPTHCIAPIMNPAQKTCSTEAVGDPDGDMVRFTESLGDGVQCYYDPVLWASTKSKTQSVVAMQMPSFR